MSVTDGQTDRQTTHVTVTCVTIGIIVTSTKVGDRYQSKERMQIPICDQ